MRVSFGRLFYQVTIKSLRVRLSQAFNLQPLYPQMWVLQ